MRIGRASEREVLEREPQRLRVGEPPLQQVQAGLERGELVVVELERRQEVALGAKGVELLAGVLVALRVEWDAEAHELGTVGVEAPRERLVAHLLVPLDVPLDVARGQRPQLRHQKRDQGELANQLVGVVTHSTSLQVDCAASSAAAENIRSRTAAPTAGRAKLARPDTAALRAA